METDPDKPSPGWLAAERDADVTLWLPGGEGRAEVPMFFRRVPPIEVWSGEGKSPLFRIGERGSGDSDKEPVHHVRLECPFFLATFPVTQAQWRGVAERCGLDPDPSRFKGDFRPVDSVNWEEVTRWCAWFAENPGAVRALDSRGGALAIETLRLPAEAEWEIACRAGTTTDYASGDGRAALELAGWFDGNSGGKTHRVGGKRANPWGFYDLHGNVSEWCEDVYDPKKYSKCEDGWSVRAWTDGDAGEDRVDIGGSLRVVRGGSWIHIRLWCRSACRLWWGPPGRKRNHNRGFRPVLVLSAFPGSGGAVPTEPD